MNSTFLFALVLSALGLLLPRAADAQSCAADAKTRRDGCTGLVHPYPTGQGCWSQSICCQGHSGGPSSPGGPTGGSGESSPGGTAGASEGTSPAGSTGGSGESSPSESTGASEGTSPAGSTGGSNESSASESTATSGETSPAVSITTEGDITTISTSEGTCTCTCESSSPSGASAASGGPSSIFTTLATSGASDSSETSESPVVTSATGASSAESAGTSSAPGSSDRAEVSSPSGVSGSTGSGGYVECELTDALYNISCVLEGYEYEIFIELIQRMQIEILSDTSLSYEVKVVRCGYMLNEFLEEHIEIKEVIYYEMIGTWGYVVDFIYVCYEIQLEITSTIITLDSNGDCPLFDALRNATQDDDEKSEVCEQLIANITIILQSSSWSYSQQQAQIYILFEQFFAEYSWKSFFFSIQIEGYGFFQYYFDVCFWYHQITIIDVAIGGDVSDCALLNAVYEASQNSSYSESVCAQFKQLYGKLETYFSEHTEISLRLAYVVKECYSQWQLSYYMEIFTYELQCGSWGDFYSIVFCSNICQNDGCGNIDDGEGCQGGSSTAVTSESSTAAEGSSPAETTPTETSPAVTSPAETSPAETSPAETSPAETSPAETTPRATTPGGTTTVKPHDCSTRWALLEVYVVNSQKESHFTNSVDAAYNTWSASVRAGFNTYRNKIRNAVFNETASHQSIFTEVIDACTDYNKNQPAKRQVLWNVTIETWNGNIGDFVNCGGNCGCS